MTLGNKKMPLSKVILRLMLYIAVYAICMLILYPYFVMFCTALKTRGEIFSVNGTVLPMEFIMYWAMGALSQMSTKLDHRATWGSTVPLTEKISPRLFKAVQNMTK